MPSHFTWPRFMCTCIHPTPLHARLTSPHSTSHRLPSPSPRLAPHVTSHPCAHMNPARRYQTIVYQKHASPSHPQLLFMPPHRYEHKVALQNAQRHCLPTASFPNPCHLADKIFVSEAVQVSRIDAGIFKMVTHIMQFGLYGPQALSTGVCHLCQANICSKKRIPCSLHISIFLIRQEAICTICDLYKFC